MRTLDVEFVTPACAYVRGHQARERIKEVTGRAPVWATISKAWVCQPHTARDVIARCERLGYAVTVSGSPAPVRDLTPDPEPSDYEDFPERLQAEMDALRAADKRAEDDAYRGRRDAHRESWNPKAGCFFPDPDLPRRLADEWAEYVGGES